MYTNIWLGIIVSEASYGAISPVVASVIGAIIITTYVIFSGIHGSAWTAAIKDIMILGVVIFLGLYIPIHYFGGIQQMFKSVEELKAIKEKIYVQKWMVFIYIPSHKNRTSIVFTGGIGNE